MWPCSRQAEGARKGPDLCVSPGPAGKGLVGPASRWAYCQVRAEALLTRESWAAGVLQKIKTETFINAFNTSVSLGKGYFSFKKQNTHPFLGISYSWEKF